MSRVISPEVFSMSQEERFRSVLVLLKAVAEHLHVSCGEIVNDPCGPGPGPPPGASHNLPKDVLYRAYAPALDAEIRVSWRQLSRHYPPLEEFPKTFDELAAFNARLAHQPPSFERPLLVQFWQRTIYSDEELAQARQDPDRYFELLLPRKSITIAVGLTGQYEGWHPQDVDLWKKLHIQNGLEEIERWRFNPASKKRQKRSPLERVKVLMRQWQQEGDEPWAEAWVEQPEAELNALPSDFEQRQVW
jgi:hypothetical protein